MDPRITALLARGPIVRADHPELTGVLDYAVARGLLVSPFRGIYLTPTASHADRVAALFLADPRAVLTHESAAHLHGWCEAPPVVRAASRRRGERAGYDLRVRTVPPHLIARSNGRRTSRALTALDLAREQGGTAIDDALRRRVPFDAMVEALAATPKSPGNAELAWLLRTSRTKPWSPAERAAHQGLRDDGITGWVANHRIHVDKDVGYTLDIAFPALRLAFEIDGYGYHQGSQAFAFDRLRDLELARAGWQVVRVPAAWVLEQPHSFARSVREVIQARLKLTA